MNHQKDDDTVSSDLVDDFLVAIESDDTQEPKHDDDFPRFHKHLGFTDDDNNDEEEEDLSRKLQEFDDDASDLIIANAGICEDETTFFHDNGCQQNNETFQMFGPSTTESPTSKKRSFEETIVTDHESDSSLMTNDQYLHHDDVDDIWSIVLPQQHNESDNDIQSDRVGAPLPMYISFPTPTPTPQTQTPEVRPTKRFRSQDMSQEYQPTDGTSMERNTNIPTHHSEVPEAMLDSDCSSVSNSVPTQADRQQHLQSQPMDPITITACMQDLMRKSTLSQSALQEWDRLNGLPRSHCQTMVNTARSRIQLQKGVVLPKWNGKPLIPGAKVVSKRKRQRRTSDPVQESRRR